MCLEMVGVCVCAPSGRLCVCICFVRDFQCVDYNYLFLGVEYTCVFAFYWGMGEVCNVCGRRGKCDYVCECMYMVVVRGICVCFCLFAPVAHEIVSRWPILNLPRVRAVLRI